MNKFGSEMKTKSGGIMSGIGKHMGAILGGAIAGIAVVKFGGDLIHAAEGAAAANAKSFKLMSSDADAAKLHFDALTQWSETFGDSIGQDDEAITNLAAKIAQSVDLTKLFGAKGAQSGLEQITRTIIDMSAATDKPQKMLTKLFQTIANDPAGALGTLTKLGVITKDQATHFKAMADAGKGAEVSQALLAATNSKYAGTAAAAATPSEKLSATMDNLKETLGSALLPLFTKFTGALASGAKWLTDWWKSGHDLSDLFDHMSGPMKTILLIVGSLVTAWVLYTTATKIAAAYQALLNLVITANPIGLLAVAVIVLAAIIVANWGKIKRVAMIVFNAVWRVVQVPFNWIKSHWPQLLVILTGPFGLAALVIIRNWDKVKSAFGTAVRFFKTVFNGVKGVVLAIWSGIVAGIKGYINVIIGAYNWLVDQLNKVQVHIHIDPPGPGSVNFDWNGPGIPHVTPLATGGFIEQTGIALVHKGETVLPAQASPLGGAVAITITNWETGTGYLRRLAEQEAGRQRAFDDRLERMRR
jgi:hypothetical protein